MKIKVLHIGPTDVPFVRQGIEHYLQRLVHYARVEMICLPETKPGKGVSPNQQKEMEGQSIINRLSGDDMAVLLDERGKRMTSAGFSVYLQKCMNRGVRNLTFITGGAYGFSDEVYNRVPEKISLSEMTFPHQLIRIIFLEQLYRAFTILKGEPYHHV
jgi:23S rRNA (pseudouridine1915-N3)-methyltransferase